MNKLILYLSLTVIALGYPSWAGSEQAGTSGASFLKLDQSVRAASLGGSFVALADDPSAIFYNPAGLLFSKYKQMSFTQTNWLIGSSYSTVCFTNPVNQDNSFGVGLSRIDYGSIQETTATSRTGTGRFFSPGSLLAVFSWARNTPRAFIGANIKYLQQNIDSYQETGIGLDLGLLSATRIDNLTLGVSLLNLGYSGDRALPQTLLIGLDYKNNHGADILGDISLQRDADPSLHLGVEYHPAPVLTVRAGIGNGKFGLGFGVTFPKFILDYAYVPYAELGNTHRAGITVRF